jgi:anaerobic dimethyl sulfoxide reductase subunit C (anchor subunit)
MNTNELPMIIFTVLGQLSVGAFVVLGIVQVFASRRHGRDAVEQVTDPALYAIGPALVLGLAASTFHMHDASNTLNVVRHLGSSWLSAEIVCGVGFAALGFLFAAAQWNKWGGTRLRQGLAVLTALVGLALVYSMSMIYYTLPTVLAWHTWATPAQFFTTTFLLGALAVGAAFTGTVMWRKRATRSGNVIADPPAGELLSTALKGIGASAVMLLGAEFLIIPLYISNLSAAGGVAAQSAAVFSGAWFISRLVLVFLGAGLLAVLLFRYATERANPRTLAVLAGTAFALVLVGELIGRSLFYESMIRIGM